MDPEQYLAAKPRRLVEAEMVVDENGNGALKVPLSNRGWWLFRLPDGATKTFYFDKMGVFVWEELDGRTSLRQLIRKFAQQYKVSDREAAYSIDKFLKMLGQKHLVGCLAEEPQNGAKA